MTLREELSQIPGVIEADIDLRDGQPTAIRIQSSDDADQRIIGEAVQYALRRHGLRSRVAPPRRTTEQPAAPAPPHLALTPAPAAEAGTLAIPGPVQAPVTSVAGDSPTRRVAAVSVLDNGARSIIQVVDAAGTVREERARRSPDAHVVAVVRATARLFDATAPLPTLVSLRRWDREDEHFITVVLDDDGATCVGSAVNQGLELRAIARAVWAALSL